MNNNIEVTTAGWTDVIGFRTAGIDGLFNLGGHFNAATGRYTAPVDGRYHLSLYCRLKLTLVCVRLLPSLSKPSLERD